MQKRYDIHRRTVRQSNAINNKYSGVIDFSQGVYGILKGAVERAREMARKMERDLKGTSAEEGPDGEGGNELPPKDSDMRLRLQALELNERELRAMALKLDLMERMQKLQSQVTIITPCSAFEKI